MTDTIIFAIPKGRILDEALPLMQAAGIEPAADFFNDDSRALMFATNDPLVSIIRVRAFDVATFVAHGAAHIGIVGSDVIDEFDYSELYAPVDLGIGKCRISVAVPEGTQDRKSDGHLRVATKYPALTRRHFESKGVQAECIKLNGAMELAPLLGLSGRIVDLVSTGRTLKENGLVETDILAQVSARLIVNRAAYKMTDGRIAEMVERFRQLAMKSSKGAASHVAA
ncbi:ATP phosphoribosyltransferase [Sphingorhabdus arenilitoris]|uniref:ATP phosphoribosyltransferase n=1 Tax=Sphingorhabdus arenilitoris TaxID=1490041 RepID=A0ABV8RG88_9SPHN